MSIEVLPIKAKKFFFKNYSYLVLDTSSKNAIVIDPSWRVENIISKVQDNNLNLSAVLLTHHHYDHVCGVEMLAKKYNMPIYISRIESEYYHFNKNKLYLLEDATELSFNNISISTILTPGHTKGGMCYLIEKNLFTGDTVFIEGCGLCWSNGGDAKEMYASIQKLKNSIYKDVLIYPGHSYGKEPGQIFSYLIQNNIYFNFNDEKEFVNFRERDGQRGFFNFV